jgi:hypothetical protein
MSKSAFKSVVPIRFVRDVSARAAFFREKLDFEIDFLHGSPPFYGSVSRDEVRLHLRFVHQPNFAEFAVREVSLILATIEVADVQGLGSAAWSSPRRPRNSPGAGRIFKSAIPTET